MRFENSLDLRIYNDTLVLFFFFQRFILEKIKVSTDIQVCCVRC